MSWFEDVPKVELHLHLEGAIPHDALWELIQKYGGDASVPDAAALEERFVFRDFDHFLAMWTWKNQFLREYEDFVLVGEAVAQDLASQNIRYAEAHFSPGDFVYHGLETQRIAESVRAGLARVSDTRVALIADVVRNYGAENATKTVEQMAEVRSAGVIGIGLGGAEHAFPAELFREAYDLARTFGFRTTAHAGEAAGAESIWSALRNLRVDRIGHGTRADEDPALVEYLKEERVPLEMCPSSNLRTGVVSSIEAHPFRRYFDAGLQVTASTDDPKMFQSSLATEYELLERGLGFTRRDISAVILAGVECSWLSKEEKAEVTATFLADPSWPA